MSQAHTYSAQILLLPNGCDKISEAAEESFLFFITNTGKKQNNCSILLGYDQ